MGIIPEPHGYHPWTSWVSSLPHFLSSNGELNSIFHLQNLKMFISRTCASLCYIILANDPWKDKTSILLEQVTPCFRTLAFLSIESKEWLWVSSVKCPKDAEKEEDATLLECQHGCPGAQVTAVVQGKWRKIWFQLVALSACAGSASPGRAITIPVSLAKDGNGGAEPALGFTADRNRELRCTSGLMQLFRAVVNYMCTSIADWFRAYAFCAIFSLIGSWQGLVSIKTIQIKIVMSCWYPCFYSILAAQPFGTWKQKCFWNKTHYTFSPAQFPDHRLSIFFTFSMPSMSITFLVYCFSPRKTELTLSCVLKEQADLNVKLIHIYACTYIYFSLQGTYFKCIKRFCHLRMKINS